MWGILNIRKKAWNSLVAIFIGIILSLILSEIILRVVPNRFAGYKQNAHSNTFSRRADKDIGLLNIPNQKSSWNSACFRIYPIHTNSLGFRGKEWSTNTNFKIAVLGDSFMEALEVPDGNTTSDILKQLLNTEVLNLGFSGYGTVAELLCFKRFLKPLKPNIVILFFFTANDIRDNSCILTKLVVGEKIYLPCSYISNGEVKDETNFVDPYTVSQLDSSPLQKIKNYLSKYFISYRVIRTILKDSRKYIRASLPTDGYVYMPEVAKDWKDAWEITEKKLIDLNNEVKANDGKLLIVSIPEYMRISKEWKHEFAKETGLKEIPNGFDPFFPLHKLENITKKHDILFLELEPYFIRYRDKFNIKPPYFSYWCNGHWNPVGHFLAANVVAKYLLEQDMLSLEKQQKTKALKRMEINLNLSPLEILGKEAYEQIYNHGIYLGSSNIDKILY